MTRRSSKITKDEIKTIKMTEKKPARKAGRPKKELVLSSKAVEIRVVKDSLKNEIVKDDKTVILETINPIHKTVSRKKPPQVKIDKKKEGITEQAPVARRANPQYDAFAIYQKQEQKKIITMWIGVGIFMFLIAAYWIYDTKRIFEQNKLAPSSANEFSLDKLSDSVRDISGKIDEFKQELAKASSTLATSSMEASRDAFNTSATTSLATTTATSSEIIEGVINSEIVNMTDVPKPELVVKELKEILTTSTELSTRASTTDTGRVKGEFEERNVISELKNKLENK